MTLSKNTPAIEDLANQIAHLIIEKLSGRQSPASPWMTPNDAGRYLSLTRRGLEDMRGRGTGPKFHKVNDRVVRYNVRDLDAWLLSNGGGHE